MSWLKKGMSLKPVRWREWRKPTIKIRGKYTPTRFLRMTFPMSIWIRISWDRGTRLPLFARRVAIYFEAFSSSKLKCLSNLS